MKYKTTKSNGLWHGYVWNDNYKSWDCIYSCSALTKLGYKHLINKYHKRLKENVESKSEEFELE